MCFYCLVVSHNSATPRTLVLYRVCYTLYIVHGVGIATYMPKPSKVEITHL